MVSKCKYKYRDEEIELESTLYLHLENFKAQMEDFYEKTEDMFYDRLYEVAKDIIKFKEDNCPWYVYDHLETLAEITKDKLEAKEAERDE
jgi:hypothetical protein